MARRVAVRPPPPAARVPLAPPAYSPAPPPPPSAELCAPPYSAGRLGPPLWEGYAPPGQSEPQTRRSHLPIPMATRSPAVNLLRGTAVGRGGDPPPGRGGAGPSGGRLGGLHGQRARGARGARDRARGLRGLASATGRPQSLGEQGVLLGASFPCSPAGRDPAASSQVFFRPAGSPRPAPLAWWGRDIPVSRHR